MNREPPPPITDDEVEAFWRDGAIMLPGLFDPDRVALLRDATAFAMDHPGPVGPKAPASFYTELGLWPQHAAFRRSL